MLSTVRIVVSDDFHDVTVAVVFFTLSCAVLLTATVLAPSMTGLVTLTVYVSEMVVPLLVIDAVTVAFPSATPVTKPLLTVRIDVSEEAQVTVPALDGSTAALSWVVVPMPTELSPEILTLATVIAQVVVVVFLPDFLVHVIVVVPVLTPVTVALLSLLLTVATEVLLDVQVYDAPLELLTLRLWVPPTGMVYEPLTAAGLI